MHLSLISIRKTERLKKNLLRLAAMFTEILGSTNKILVCEEEMQVIFIHLSILYISHTQES